MTTEERARKYVTQHFAKRNPELIESTVAEALRRVPECIDPPSFYVMMSSLVISVMRAQKASQKTAAV